MTHDYPEIRPSEIREGDLIRFEHSAPESFTAVEFEVRRDGHEYLPAQLGTHFLIDRPTPPVDLPKTRTLGWLSWRDDLAVRDTTKLGIWRLTGGPTVTDYTGVPARVLTAFVAATAVPTEALDELRKYRSELDFGCATPAVRRIDKFLAAVDQAQS